MTHVFLLWHFRDEDNEETWKMVGIYTNRQNAEAAIQRKLSFPGFEDYPDNFLIERTALDLDLWSEGFGVD